MKLLSTYDESSATQAKEDAEKCVLDFIGKQDVFIMDHLLKLKPVEILAGQPIHKVLVEIGRLEVKRIYFHQSDCYCFVTLFQ